MEKIVNLTPHEVTLVGDDGKVLKTSFPSQGSLRLPSTTERVGTLSIDGVEIPITKTSFGGLENLPKEEEGTIYIVSLLTCQAAPNRGDFYIPNESVRDENGRIVGCRSLAQNPYFGGSKQEVGQ